MVNADEFTGIVEVLLANEQFKEVVKRSIEDVLLTRNDVLPVDDFAARIVHFHGLRNAVRAVAKVAEKRGELHVAGKLRALLPGIKK
jgi:hypothetical protein